MQVIRHLTNLPAEARGGVVAIGNFDGIHRGHQAVVARAAALADEMGVPLGVILFEPYPREFFNPNAPHFRVTSFHSKARLLERLGVDLLYVLNFDRALANKPAPDFVLDVLVKNLGVLHVVVGYDFQFGRGRSGDVNVLSWIGLMEGFGVTIVEPVLRPGEGQNAGQIFSSTRIREHIVAGRMREAADLLGHWWSVDGHVQRGIQRGRMLGFPTINIELGKLIAPALGIYAVWVEIQDVDERQGGARRLVRTVHRGCAYVSKRPRAGKDEILLEVHLLDFAGDLYGRQVRVSFVDFIRADASIADTAELKARIGNDCAAAHRLLAEPWAALDVFAPGLDAVFS